MTSGWCPGLLALVRATCNATKVEPPPPSSHGGSKDHKWLVHNDCRHSFGSEADKRLVPTGCRNSFKSMDDKRLVPPVVGILLGGFCRCKGRRVPRLTRGLGHRFLTFVWE